MDAKGKIQCRMLSASQGQDPTDHGGSKYHAIINLISLNFSIFPKTPLLLYFVT